MEFKQGQEIFDINENGVLIYSYVCKHPNKEYEIFLDNNQQPVRLHHTEVLQILEKRFETIQDASRALAMCHFKKYKSIMNSLD